MSDVGLDDEFPYEPGIEAGTPDDLDGIDLDAGEGCPHCGGPRHACYLPGPAGYYACGTCGALWAGDRDNAELIDEPYRGPAVDGESE